MYFTSSDLTHLTASLSPSCALVRENPSQLLLIFGGGKEGRICFSPRSTLDKLPNSIQARTPCGSTTSQLLLQAIALGCNSLQSARPVLVAKVPIPGGGHEYVGADEQNNRREIRRQERHKNSLGEPNRGGLLVITGRRQRSSAPVTCPSQPCSKTTLLLSDTCVPLLAVPTAGSSGPQIFSYEKTCGRLAHSRGLARAPTGAT
jgi:hypothetical protein